MATEGRTEGESRPDSVPAVSVRELEKVYADAKGDVKAVDGISFEIDHGNVVGLLGPNGAGKTTTIKSILALIRPTNGLVRVQGVDVFENTRAAHEKIAANLEGARDVYWRLTVRENLEVFSAIGGNDYRAYRDEIDGLVEQFGLVEKKDTLVKDLSRGQKQKLSIACTLARFTDIVFLDEPTLGLDVEMTLELREILRDFVNDERTVILSSHDMDVIEDVCDRVIIMSEGRIIADDSVENLIEVFGSNAFEISVAGTLSTTARQQLEAEFAVDHFEERGEMTHFTVEVQKRELYELMHVLEESGEVVESINEAEPNFDEVFLNITDNE